MTYYIKRLGFQELGSVTETGTTNRGRYIYISKDQSVLSEFPPLSETVHNDMALLPIVPLYNDRMIKTYCSLVYNNDKYHGSTARNPRNEYRLYLNNMLENNELLFKTDDIVVLKPEVITVEVDGFQEEQKVYYLDLIQEESSELYQYLNELINESSLLGGHATYNGNLSYFEDKITSMANTLTVEQRVDDSVTRQLEDSSEEYVAQLFNASNFRDFLMVGYQELCAVSRTVIRSDRFLNLEAAHIKPNSHGGLFLPNNGLALSRDLHFAFDKGFFTINDDFTIRVHDEVTSDYLKNYDGEKIYVPSDNFFQPSQENLAYHQNEVFGLFLTSGRL